MNIWIIGSGLIAQEYAKILKHLGKNYSVLGRGQESAKRFESATGDKVNTLGLNQMLANESAPHMAIVAVTIDQLANVTCQLIQHGTKRILLEKPGGLNSKELLRIQELAEKHNCEVMIAYNRRFYSSTEEARKLILEDGGITSALFEFTEWPSTILPLHFSKSILEAWFFSNSSHVVDLFIHFCGRPKDWNAWHGGSLDWHPSGSKYCGAGITERGVFFNYHADWEAPGRWGVELLTRKRRFIFRPMEKLQVTLLDSVKVEPVQTQDEFDLQFKPGFYKQTTAFLANDFSLFCSLKEQIQNFSIYEKITGY